jgi:hypothetical protein
MTATHTLDGTINEGAFRSALILIAAGVLSLFLPLDAPEGPLAERMLWFSSNLDAFILGWTVQLVMMLSLSGVLAGVAWQIREPHPVRTFVAGTALLISVVAFIIPKFIAIWSVPQMVVASATASADSVVAERLLHLSNPSLGFSLTSSLDYLGFWMYAIFGLLVAQPLFRLAVSAKIAAVGFGLYGLLYHLLLAGVMARSVATAEIGGYAESLGVLLLISVIAMAVHFRRSSATGED